MIQMEIAVVIPQNFYFLKKLKHDKLLEKLNNYHSKIKVTIEVRPTKFFDTSLHLNNGTTISKFVGKQPNNLHIRH